MSSYLPLVVFPMVGNNVKVLRLDLPLVGMSSFSSSLVCHALSGLLAMRLRLVSSTI